MITRQKLAGAVRGVTTTATEVTVTYTDSGITLAAFTFNRDGTGTATTADVEGFDEDALYHVSADFSFARRMRGTRVFRNDRWNT